MKALFIAGVPEHVSSTQLESRQNMKKKAPVSRERIDDYINHRLSESEEFRIEQQYDDHVEIRQLFHDCGVVPFHLQPDDPKSSKSKAVSVADELDAIESEMTRLENEVQRLEEHLNEDIDITSMKGVAFFHQLAEYVKLRTITRDPAAKRVFMVRIGRRESAEIGEVAWGTVDSVEHDEDLQEEWNCVTLRMLPETVSRHHESLKQALLTLIDVRDRGVVPWLHLAVSEDSRLHLISELIQGETVRQKLLRETRLSVFAAVEILRSVADSLSRLHERQLVHTDIRAENVLLSTDGGEYAVRLLDFGLAGLVRRSLAEVGEPFPRGWAMQASRPPEYWIEFDETPATDQWGLSCLSYEMLTGQPCFHPLPDGVPPCVSYGDGWRAALTGRLQATIPVFARSFSPHVSDRFADASQFVESLVAALDSPWIELSPPGATKSLPELSSLPVPHLQIPLVHSATLINTAPQIPISEAAAGQALSEPRIPDTGEVAEAVEAAKLVGRRASSRKKLGVWISLGIPIGLAASASAAIQSMSADGRFLSPTSATTFGGASGDDLLVREGQWQLPLCEVQEFVIQKIRMELVAISEGQRSRADDSREADVGRDVHEVSPSEKFVSTDRTTVPARNEGRSIVQAEGQQRFMEDLSGSPEGLPDPLRLALRHRFLISTTEVSVEDFQRVMAIATGRSVHDSATDPAQVPRLQEPVHVTMEQATSFCNSLSALANLQCRLPTEQEWEYSLRFTRRQHTRDVWLHDGAKETDPAATVQTRLPFGFVILGSHFRASEAVPASEP
jgi:serine/threonine-protein kinase